MYKYIVILGLFTLTSCATQPQVTPLPPTQPTKIATLNIVSSDKAADGCALGNGTNGDNILACKPGCSINFGPNGKVDRVCK